MPLTELPPQGRTFFCPHCGALYSVTHSQLSKSERNVTKCVVCLQLMDDGDSRTVSVYKLTASATSMRCPGEAGRPSFGVIRETAIGASMANDALINLLAWCQREREQLQMQREMLKAGRFRIFENDDSGPRDISNQHIEQITANIAELDRLLAEYYHVG